MKKILLSSLTFGLLVATAMAGLVFRQDIENDICLNRAPVQAPVATPVVAAVDTSSPKMVWPLGQIPERTINYPSVGTLTLYGNMVNPKTFVLFLSGDGGWNLGVIDMAKTLAADGQTLLVGIDIIKYYKILQSTTEKCLYPAGDMENLSEFVQKKLNLTTYHTPILVGYSSGATLTYALLCQAPAGTFKGGVALGFCPDVQLDKPLCEGSG